RYSYKLIPHNLAVALELCSQDQKPDSYLANDAEAQALRKVLEDGYRWVNSTSEYMVFEKEVEGFDARQFARDLIGAIDHLHQEQQIPGCRFAGVSEVTCPVCHSQDMLAPLAGILPITEEEEGAADEI